MYQKSQFGQMTDLDKIAMMAKYYAKTHNCNYNIILLNPNGNGDFEPNVSSYEFVVDSYFEKERPNAVLLMRTETPRNVAVSPKQFIISNPHVPKPHSPQYQSPVIRKPKIGRNSLCLCNSGRKYKHCCFNNK